MITKIESIKAIYIICKDSDEGIDLRDKFIDFGIYSYVVPGVDKWVLRIDIVDLSKENYDDLEAIIADIA